MYEQTEQGFDPAGARSNGLEFESPAGKGVSFALKIGLAEGFAATELSDCTALNGQCPYAHFVGQRQSCLKSQAVKLG